MENNNTYEVLLWSLAGIIACSMIIVLTLGWMKGNHWQREIKLKKRQSGRYV